MKPAGLICMDRDGTLIEEKQYLHDPADVRLIPGAADELEKLHKKGFVFAIVTNQSGIGRGYYTEEDMHSVHREIERQLEPSGVTFSSIHFCPHLPDAGCACRKPKPTMIRDAREQAGVTPERTFMIGDKAADIEAGRRAGVTTLLVRSGYGEGTEADGNVSPDHTCDTVTEALQWIDRNSSS